MKYMTRTAGYTWTVYKTNTQITKKLQITPILDKLLEYKRNWIQNVNSMPRNRLPRVMKHYFTNDRRNHGGPLKILLGTWDWNGSTSDRTAWQIDDDDDDDGREASIMVFILTHACNIKQQHAYQLIHIHPIVLQNTCYDTTPDNINRFRVWTNHSNHCSCKFESNS